jgi:hypothetical protein
MKPEKRFNSTLYGVIPGIVIPVLALAAVWLFKYQGGFFSFLKEFQQQGVLARLLSLAALPNLGLFFLFIWTDRSFSARGVIFATLVIAVVMVVLKFS